ncbi:hypothetical protein QBC43DRAFT_213770 [Cladorrhinum sp. PSN259]|nr:hypothetical protein QBC43DRAFT_213770 [Cladorrhinum sp. PSN259]
MDPISRCKGCDHPREVFKGGYTTLRSSLSFMITRSKEGCVPCLVLSNGIQHFLHHNQQYKNQDFEGLQINFNLAGPRRSLELSILNTDINLSFFCSEYDDSISKTFPDIPIANDPPSTTSSDASLKWAVDQLQNCKDNHTTCNYSPTSFPTRLLDISNNRIRLDESFTNNYGAPPYIALSHCWGRLPFLRTLSTNFDAHKTEIPMSSLPPTFRNAINLTRRLSINYLWIDSLCIIQDDPSDWQKEASIMASIYEGATLVISASHSDSAYGGLYTSFPSTHRSYIVPDVPSPFEGLISVRRPLTHPFRTLSPYHPSQGKASSLPAFTRGWILQERLLSRRILHFTAQELTWECLGESQCQCTPSSLSSTTPPSVSLQSQETNFPTWFKHQLARVSSPKTYYSPINWRCHMSPLEQITSWHHLVEDYTKLELTYPSDIFPAMGGIARVYRNATCSGEYSAGLWEASLIYDLLWHVLTLPGAEDDEQKGKKKSRPEKWRAPSWSWASVLGPVEYLNTGHEDVEEGCEVLDKTETPKTRDPVQLDVLEGGYLKNLRVDDEEECKGIAEEDGKHNGEVVLVLVCKKLPRKELLFLLLSKADDKSQGCVEEEHKTYKRIGLLEVFGGPKGWVDDLLGKGEDTTIRIL